MFSELGDLKIKNKQINSCLIKLSVLIFLVFYQVDFKTLHPWGEIIPSQIQNQTSWNLRFIFQSHLKFAGDAVGCQLPEIEFLFQNLDLGNPGVELYGDRHRFLPSGLNGNLRSNLAFLLVHKTHFEQFNFIWKDLRFHGNNLHSLREGLHVQNRRISRHVFQPELGLYSLHHADLSKVQEIICKLTFNLVYLPLQIQNKFPPILNLFIMNFILNFTLKNILSSSILPDPLQKLGK